MKSGNSKTVATKLEILTQPQLKKELPDIRPGDTLRIHQKIKEKGKERIQAFEGIVIARKHGKGISSTITVRKVISGIGVEKVFPIHSPIIEKIEILKRGRVRRAKLYYLRKAKGKKTKLKRKKSAEAITEKTPETIEEKKPAEEEVKPASAKASAGKEEKPVEEKKE